jgi:hypothetical protein
MPNPNPAPVDPRRPPGNAVPGSHSTGGAKDHATANEGERSDGQHSSAPSMTRKADPMASQEPSTTPRQDPKLRIRRDIDRPTPPDEDT